MSNKVIEWNGGVQQEAVNVLKNEGGLIVSPTKVGYIIMTSDGKGLERKFDAKNRKRNKPGVVLCGSMEQLGMLAEMNDEIYDFYQKNWDADVLLGCILPWKRSGAALLPNDGSKDLMMDARGTSCFVIKFGTPSENTAKELWEKHGKFCFASSANPSGQGNRGLVEGIGERIHDHADLIVSSNSYVKSIQPNEEKSVRYEQGVMISMVDAQGKLIPLQKGERLVSPAPALIRKGLDFDKIMSILADSFNSWDYRQGDYY